MGTAVLYPQDCLRTRRLKHHDPAMIYRTESVPRARKLGAISSQNVQAGLLPLPNKSLNNSPTHKGHESKQSKPRKVTDKSGGSMFLADLAQEDPTYRILQRTKQVGLSEAEEHVDAQIKDATAVPRMRASSPAFLKDSLKTVLCSDSSLVQHHRSRDVFLPPLRRTSTDPAIVKHVGDRFSKSVAVNAPESGRIFPCEEERWAGPAYSSSPPPSSLPFPKLCLPRAKVISHTFTPLVKQHSISVHIPLREPYAPTSPCSMDGGASDVAFATRNLRRLLNLDAR